MIHRQFTKIDKRNYDSKKHVTINAKKYDFIEKKENDETDDVIDNYLQEHYLDEDY